MLRKTSPHLNIGYFSNFDENKTELFLRTINELGKKYMAENLCLH